MLRFWVCGLVLAGKSRAAFVAPRLLPPTQPVQRLFFASQQATTPTTNSGSTTTTATTTTTAVPANEDIILYDGVCNFCNTWVDLLLRIDKKKLYRFAPLQSKVGRDLLVSIGKEADDISSVVLVKANGESYDKSLCVLKVVEELGPVARVASKAASAIVPRRFRDGIYDTVATNRYRLMGKRDECRCSDPKFADRFILD